MPAYSKLLPQPSQQFIEKYIEEYNKGNIITDVLFEYDLTWNEEFSTDGINSMMKCSNPIEILKINPKDNTITIKSVKESWNREEVKKLLLELSSFKGDSEDYEEVNEWIEENL